MERPVFNEEMSLELAKITTKYLNEDDPCDDDKLLQIAAVLRRHWTDDGYKLGKEFEDDGYRVDVNMVNDLDCVHGEGEEILKRHIKQWVISENIALSLKPGDGVQLKRPINGQNYGIIYNVEPETAQYGVRTPDITGPPTARYIVNCENVIFVPPLPE